MEIAGAPDLPKLTTSLVIPDNAEMEAVVVSSSYKDFPGMDIAPSKGVITRDIDPATVPYRYGEEYSRDAFYPGTVTGMRDPYIIRDLRGQTLIVYPFQYNPVTKVLRVYNDLTIEVRKVSDNGMNPLVRKTKDIRFNKEFNAIYSRHFLNYGSLTYTPLNDYGNILVISYGTFMTAMQPYIDWKRSIGYPTTMVSIDSVGTSSAEIKQYITNYYEVHGLTFVLLVGDNQQVTTYEGSGVGGASDNYYGYIVGNDHYADIFIGRFSAETIDQVNTQVQRTLDYEKNPQFRTDNWLTSVIGIGSDQGPGDDDEYDYQHIRNQQTKLLAYTYTWNPELFDGSQGGNDAPGNPGPSDVTSAVNDGASLILYCGHGSMTSWGTTSFSNGDVNTLTNQGKLPFIWSVACVNGQFMNGTCFAEAWLRASKNGQPTGAIAFLGSTINQSWNSPMAGQDEMTDILVESYPDNIKRTFAGISINGCMEMIDEYGTDGANMADTWTVFGDPSVMVRTKNPDTLIVSNATYLPVGVTSLLVTCNENGARATLLLSDTILATGLINNDTIVFSFPALINPGDTVLLTVSNYNAIPYQSNIYIIAPVTADFTGTPLLLHVGDSVTFTDHSTGNPLSWNWSFPGGKPSTSTLQNPVVTYSLKGTFDVQLIVSNHASSDTMNKINYIEADYPARVENLSGDLSITVSPNPNNGIFKVSRGSFKGYGLSLSVFNPVGTVVYEETDFAVNDKSGKTIDLSTLKEGIYFLKVKSDNATITRKVIIRK
jgi:cytochrome oxidase Cu insertion factor (SCO1/SenC/PrrC family)